ncbi:YybH family protein [Epibacterium ulvae]|uniref:YybH family protein n=1 Tax=Epibacterium ulvae TaxID=1156985 RepID=UPI0024937C4D|nr:nuclear transport factor 2 family protein [Epibacterium ulvae]
MRFISTVAALALSAGMALADSKQDVVDSLNAFNDLFNEYTVAKNVEGLVSLYAEDALWIEQNKPLAQGHDAIRPTFAFLASKNGVNDHSIDKLVVADDGSLAVMVGTAIVKVEEFNLDTTGTFLFVMKPEGDSWKIVTDMWHQHQPQEQQ